MDPNHLVNNFRDIWRDQFSNNF